MKARGGRFFAWPGWGHVSYFVALAVALSLWFGVVYGGTDWLTARRANRLHVQFAFELAWPFVPEAIVVYDSVYLLFGMAPFVLRTRQELRALATTLAIVILCGGIGFLLFPAELQSSIPPDLGRVGPLFRASDRLNLEFNLAPSLHVALAVAYVAVYSRHAEIAGKLILWCWAGAIAASTILTYQHHLVDAVTGFALGVLVTRLVYDRAGGPNGPD